MGAREGREVAVRSVHQIAVEQDDRARLADGSHYAVGMGELSETILVRHTIFLLLERYFVMVVRSFAYAGQKDPMRTRDHRSEEHTSELQSLMRISYAVFCLKKKTTQQNKAS